MKKKAPLRPIVLSSLLFLTASSFIRAQIVVTAPAAKVAVKPAPDYATETLYDRWDMNERTDFGWRIFNTVEEPKSYLMNISFSGGIFSATSQYTPPLAAGDSDANIMILESAYVGAADIGKFGVNHKINADKYTVFAVRMYISSPVHAWPTGQLFWTRNTIYGGSIQSNTFTMRSGWGIYLIDLPALGVLGGGETWSGLVDSLRFDPVVQADKNIQIDWIRLVEKGAAYQKTITWSGSTSVDIYLDNDTSAANGNSGLLAKTVSGGSYSFLTGALAAGNYYVAIAPAGTTTYAYSQGYYCVAEQPIIRITKPSDEGSDQDFIDVATGNPWDFSSLNDVDHTVNVHGAQIRTIDYEDLAGRTYTGNSVYYGLSDTVGGNVGDPTVFFLNYAYRGKTYPIDTSRYHNLVCKMGIDGVHSTNDGSIARVIWRINDETKENVGQDIIIRHMLLDGGKWIMHKFIADMKTLPLETGDPNNSTRGWTGMVDCFRIDPHEFPTERAFFFDDVKLTADWRVDASFTIEYEFEDADTLSGATLALYYDTDQSGYNGTLIRSGIALAGPQSTGSAVWNTSAVPGGTYYVYAVVTDGENENKFYATGPVIVNHAGSPTITLSKKSLSFGAESNGPASSPEDIVLANSGTGTLNWSASRSADWISVSPSSGIGGGVLRIGVARTNLWAGTYTGTVTVTDSNATNSPQTISVTLRVVDTGTDAVPFGTFDTPMDGSTVSSSVPVTGWVLDDIGVATVKIYRDPVVGETPGVRVFIGDAVFVQGARPDVEAAYPGIPGNDRAGWGYMMLTNFLPNQGNGAFRLLAYATDLTGHEIQLGAKSIVCDNAHAVKPFGAIDTPTQGGTAQGAAFYNWGWALTPMPKSIPTNGSTITVYVDGAPLGNPVYNLYRSDIATLFPGYANSGGAVGYYLLNTTPYVNGVHTIAWVVTDSQGLSDGIGSRFFSIVNTGGTGGGVEEVGFNAMEGKAETGSVGGRASRREEGGISKALRPSADMAGIPEDRRTPVYARRGFDPMAGPETVFPAADGTLRIKAGEAERVAIYWKAEDADEGEAEMMERGRAMRGEKTLGAARSSAAGIRGRSESDTGAGFEAWLSALGELRPLPIGSSFDAVDGVFYWQPGPGFLGTYEFIFVDKNQNVKKAVHIEIVSKS